MSAGRRVLDSRPTKITNQENVVGAVTARARTGPHGTAGMAQEEKRLGAKATKSLR